jgi:circadian clock protein KaiC
VRAGGATLALSVARRLIYQTKQEGITLLCTSLLPGEHPEAQETELGISTVADTWIHLSYQSYRGEHNRKLSIVKARGKRHSNQVRELVLSDDGIGIAEPFVEGGAVLMGTLRWQKEQELELQRELELAEVQARRQAIEADIRLRRKELTALEKEQELKEQALQRQRIGTRQKRQFTERAGPGSLSGAQDEESSSR